MANTVKPSSDEMLKHLESLKNPGAQIIKAISNVIISAMEGVKGEDLQDQISKVCLLHSVNKKNYAREELKE